MKQELAADTTLSHYRIVAKLGSGGMGEVWLAEDTRLERQVALKLLPAEFTQDADRVGRFMREAKAASALSHPNIITVYDIGVREEGRFIVMELVAGRTLHAVIAEDNSLETLLSLGQQIAKALAAAHAAGITHRDIKPDNIMVRDDGYVKVLDFGLARLRPATESGEESATLAQQTTPGTVLGTVAYMSPEQARGETVSHPSDVFALGIVLYELVTGRHPFQSGTLVGYLHAITLQEPPPLTQWKPELPASLNDLILRMLSKDASQRPTATEVAQALQDIARRGDTSRESSGEAERVSASDDAQTFMLRPVTTAATESKVAVAESAQATTSGSPKTRKWSMIALLSLLALTGGFFAYRSFAPSRQAMDSLAILPFQNRSGNADSEYLSDGLAESLIYRLSQLPNLKVSPTSSVFRYKGKDADPLSIAKELRVQAVMTGHIAQRGETLVISVELVDVRNSKTLWGEQYQRKLTDLLAIQREMTTEIAQRLQLKLSGEGEQKLAKKYTDNNEAYQLYLQGRHHWSLRTKEQTEKAIECYRRAISIDPNYALAFVGIADAYNSMGKNPDLAPKEAIPPAKEAARRAMEIDPELAEAHAALADSAAIYDWDWPLAEREFRLALELNPNVSYTHVAYGTSYLSSQGLADELVAEIKRALEIEPVSLINNSVLVTAYLYARQYDKALQQGRRAYDLDPNFKIAHHWLGLAYNANGQADEAVKLIEESLKTSPSSTALLFVIGLAHAKQGHRREAEQYLVRLREEARTRYVRTYWLACIYAALGDKDKAFAELEQSFQDRDIFLPRMKLDPDVDPLRDDPRFKNLLKRMNLPE